MRKHNGMRPQDIAILLKIIALDGKDWQLTTLSGSLFISLSEISESLNRSMLAGLIDHSKKRVNRLNLLEFLEHGIHYVFPQQPGAVLRGIATAHSHPFMAEKLVGTEMHYIWQEPQGEIYGQQIEPLYAHQTRAAQQDDQFYKLLALVDVIRVGRAREVKIAMEELKHIIGHGNSN